MLALHIFASAFLAGIASASLSLGKDGSISAINGFDKDQKYSDVALKEVCYRNLYADLDAFEVKETKEVVVQDSRKATVFMSQGVLRNEEDVALLYEEFCYKQYRLKEHSMDVHAASGLLVGKRDLIGSLGLASLGSVKAFESSGSEPDGAGLFSKGSFLDSLANDSPLDGDSSFDVTQPDLKDGSSEALDAEMPAYKPDTSSTGAKVDAVTDKKAPDATFAAGRGESASPDGKGKRAWSWRRFVMRSEVQV